MVSTGNIRPPLRKAFLAGDDDSHADVAAQIQVGGRGVKIIHVRRPWWDHTIRSRRRDDAADMADNAFVRHNARAAADWCQPRRCQPPRAGAGRGGFNRGRRSGGVWQSGRGGGSVTMGWASGTGVGVGAGRLPRHRLVSVGGAADWSPPEAAASCFKYIAATKAKALVGRLQFSSSRPWC